MATNNVARARTILDEACRQGNPFDMRAMMAAAQRELDDVVRAGGGLEPNNPADVMNRPPLVGPTIEPLLAPNQYLVLENTPLVPPQTTTAPIRLEFSSGSGWLIGWRGVAVDLTVGAGAAGRFEQATMAVEFIINDSQNLITNGVAADFAPFLTLFGEAVNSTPILRYVNSKDIARFRFRNLQRVGGSDLQPFLTFAFFRDPRWC
jgi:hypothetical protein